MGGGREGTGAAEGEDGAEGRQLSLSQVQRHFLAVCRRDDVWYGGRWDNDVWISSANSYRQGREKSSEEARLLLGGGLRGGQGNSSHQGA